MAYFTKICLFYLVIQNIVTFNEAKSFNGDLVTIGGLNYKMVHIPESGEKIIKRISVNSKGDIYLSDDATIFAFYKGSDEVVRVEGIRYRVMHGFAVDSKDNLFYIRLFDGLFVLWDGVGTETDVPNVHIMANSMTVDIHDTLYLGNQYQVVKVKILENSTVLTDYIYGFEYGFRVPAAVDSKGDMYYREGFQYLVYMNIYDVPSSRRVIPEIGKEKTLGAACDSKDNVFVASEEGLYWIKNGSKGIGIEKVMKFDNMTINSVYADWKDNDVLYMHISDYGFYKLIPQ